jgi:hypothetical protein
MIAILQPYIPHYREEFYKGIGAAQRTDIYCYETSSFARNNNFKLASLKVRKIGKYAIGPFLWYNPLPFFRKDYDKIILMLNFTHLTTWIILLTKFLHKKEIVLMGQGISVKRYLKEEKKPSVLLKWMIQLSDILWTYTKKEQLQWKKIFANKPIIALNNTLSGIQRILDIDKGYNKDVLKRKYQVKQKICFIFCARFTTPHRRTDLLEKLIQKLNPLVYGFIIIGDGSYKPDFSVYNNVYDYGAVYDARIKDDLFSIADVYLQPGWVGLSVVEALSYGKPVFTFNRQKGILQCVEFSYLVNNFNALIFDDLQDALTRIKAMNTEQLEKMSINAVVFVKKNLLMDNMIQKAINSLGK